MSDKQISTTNSAITLESLQTVKNIIAKGATDQELVLFAQYCNRTGLDPFSNQIHFIKRGDKPTFQTSIDGYRSVASRTGEYEGQTPVMWCGEDGIWVDVWLKTTKPVAAKAGVFRKGFKEPVIAVAKYSSYAVTTNQLWNKMPEVMLAKVAEALALRKAFPNVLAGLYSDEEMDQANPQEPTVPAEAKKETKPAEKKVEVEEGEVVDHDDRPLLSEEKLHMMLRAIVDGETDKVRERMANYKLARVQETLLNKALMKKDKEFKAQATDPEVIDPADIPL